MQASKTKRNIGIFGGSFDPIHNGHVFVAQQALDTFHLDEVCFLPCRQQVLKTYHQTAAEHRLAMLRLALADHPKFTIDTRELYRQGNIYTYDTLLELSKELPNAQLWFILGMDSVDQFTQWHQYKALLTLCKFITVQREGASLPSAIAPELKPLTEHIITATFNASSTEIRNKVANHALFRYPIHPLVECYLKDHKLYSSIKGETHEID